jgi:glutathione S-transferase
MDNPADHTPVVDTGDADILMSDVLRMVDRFDGPAEYPACPAYVERATARPAFKKAHADQIEHFEAAD